MEAYIIIISAAITAIAIAYKIATNLKNNASSFKIFPMVLKDGNYVLSFPVGTFNELSNTTETIDPINAVKVYLKIKEVGSIDVDMFAKMSTVINWYSIINNIINDTQIEQPDYSTLDSVNLYNSVIIECIIELETPIKVHIQINTDLTINILKN